MFTMACNYPQYDIEFEIGGSYDTIDDAHRGALHRRRKSSVCDLIGEGLRQSVVVAIHLKDADVMGHPVEERAGETLGNGCHCR